MTATLNEWKTFSEGMYLGAGDKVKLTRYVKNLSKAEGIVICKKRVNFVVDFNGKRYVVNPRIIEFWKKGDGAIPNEQDEQVESPVFYKPNKSYQNLMSECSVGDFVLMNRGRKYDVIRIIEMPGGRSSKLLAQDISNGKKYRYDPDWYIMKLDSTRFSHE